MIKSDSYLSVALDSPRQEAAESMLTSHTDRPRESAIAELDRLLASLADPNAMLGPRAGQWSHRKSLSFIVVSSASLWAVTALALARVLALT